MDGISVWIKGLTKIFVGDWPRHNERDTIKILASVSLSSLEDDLIGFSWRQRMMLRLGATF